MKAIIYHKYGLPTDLHLEEVEKPVPKGNQVLVKVHAASINSWDWDLLRGTPFINRIMSGLLRPTKIKILGCDIAGRVEAIGPNVKRFQSGSEVFGDISECGWGGFAEYVCASENVLAVKPAGWRYEEAAAIPQAAVLALQGLRKGQIQSAHKVLVNGASGGVGSFAVPLAKSYGAEVTGVCSTRKMEFVRALGADHVIDYSQEDFTNNGQHYDLILDVMAHHSIFDYKRALGAKGIYVMVGGDSTVVKQILLLGPLISMCGKKKMGLLWHKPNANDLDYLVTLIESDKVTPVIDKRFRLSETTDAMRYFVNGNARGKVVITMDKTNEGNGNPT